MSDAIDTGSKATLAVKTDVKEEMGEVNPGGDKGEIWWSNGIFFVSLHLFAIYGALYLSPLTSLPNNTLILCFFSWQLAAFGITIGYHRLWSHRAFTARLPLRIVLAWMGSMGFQGSIRWWVLRHRLHHRFTDSPAHDPYSASKGLWYSHCGWIFRKPTYPRMKLIERDDLEADPVVRYQHKYYIAVALFSGLILPALIGHTWGDALGGLVWGGAVARLLIWHTTFCINSLAHWTGLRPYTEEVSARGNYLLAILTAGEGNHNFHHAFPKDFRNGPHPADWDPSKWIIYTLHRLTPFVPSLAVTPPSSILKAQAMVLRAEADRLTSSIPAIERERPAADQPLLTRGQILRMHGEWVVDTIGEAGWRKRRRVLVLIGGWVVDVGGYLDEHPGGQQLLLDHCVAPLPADMVFTAPLDTDEADFHGDTNSSPSMTSTTSAESSDSTPTLIQQGTEADPTPLPAPFTNPLTNLIGNHAAPSLHPDHPDQTVFFKEATRPFYGGLNNHSAAAKDRMRGLRIAKLKDIGE